jgi:hypothetical protein
MILILAITIGLGGVKMENGKPPGSGNRSDWPVRVAGGKNGVSHHAAFAAPREHENGLGCGYLGG